jgi:hypothetical protein
MSFGCEESRCHGQQRERREAAGSGGREYCGFSAARASRVLSDVQGLPALLDRYAAALDGLDSGAARSHAGTSGVGSDRSQRVDPPPTLAKLSGVLNTVRDALKLHECKDVSSSQRMLSVASLDEMHRRVWRMHSQLRKARAQRADRPLRVLALGDSITDGGLKQRAYRYHLHRLLTEAGVHVRWLG